MLRENLVVVDDAVGHAPFDIELVDVPILSASRQWQIGVMTWQRRRVEVEMQQSLGGEHDK